ncbi:helix-turn-helix domain-containing protein, partial [Limosilactobacillus mucosae]
ESKKKALVKEFNSSSESALVFAAKHGIASDRSLREWVIRYNESKATVYTPRKRDSIMPGRKTTFEERLSIIEDLIKHDVNYSWAVDKYHVSYQQVYGWYQKYRKSGNDPQSLRDRRGKAKPKAEWTELDKLRAENRLLKAEVKRNEMEVAFAKKLIEIRNREAKSSSNNKPSKN